MKEAMFYEKLEGNKVRCRLCPWNCLVKEGSRGVCNVRENRDGKLYSLSYNNLSSGTVDPIEKKPLFNFAPGTRTYSIATPGCNWKCKYCQNWQLSQGSLSGRSVSPEEIVEMAKKSGAEGISYTYTEPTIFYELAYETAKMAHREGLYNTFVTNGYISPEPVEKIGPYLDAVTVDFKGSGDEEFLEEFAGVRSAEPIYGALKEYKNQGVHVEVTDLIVPRVGDSEAKIEELVGWILNNLGKETPVHFLRFYPAHKVQDIPPTDVDKLKTAREIAESAGMDYVYLGNVRANNATRCPDCGNVVISRSAGMVTGVDIEDSDCPSCGASVNVSGLSWVMKNR